MDKRKTILAAIALCVVLITSLAASAKQQQPAPSLVEWEYVDTTPIPQKKPTPQLQQPMPKSYKSKAFNILIGTESNGKHFGAPGSVAGHKEPSRSSKGAIGIAQVMPKTAQYIAKRKGITWNQHKYKHDPAYNRKLGFLYFEYLFDSFSGDLSKVYAAYNAGPTRLRSTVKKHGRNWLAHMPRETRTYVRKNMNQFSKSYPEANV